jgi:nucleoid-associated protein YgaU
MASRYQNNETKKSNDGRTVFRSKIYPNIPLKDDDVYVATESGDRLDTLAHQFYGDSTLWWIIASANNIHNAVFGLEDGTVLRIPQNYIQILNNFTR